jgi:hypothetical protein
LIIIELNGGLGNQLFQYAAAYSLAKEHQEDLAVYLGTMNKYGTWNYEIFNFFQIDLEVINFNIFNTHIYNEPEFYYKKINRQNIYKNNFFLSGYFQSEKYFYKHISGLREQFHARLNLSKTIYSLYLLIKSKKTIFFHIRRGDYLKYKNIYNIIDEEHVLMQIKKVLKKEKYEIIGGFSDNKSIVNKIFSKLDCNSIIKINFSELQMTLREEFTLMTAFTDSIIANSSFSWWAAYLNDNIHKRVYFPSIWFNDIDLRNKSYDLIPEDWIPY